MADDEAPAAASVRDLRSRFEALQHSRPATPNPAPPKSRDPSPKRTAGEATAQPPLGAEPKPKKPPPPPPATKPKPKSSECQKSLKSLRSAPVCVLNQGKAASVTPSDHSSPEPAGPSRSQSTVLPTKKRPPPPPPSASAKPAISISDASKSDAPPLPGNRPQVASAQPPPSLPRPIPRHHHLPSSNDHAQTEPTTPTASFGVHTETDSPLFSSPSRAISPDYLGSRSVSGSRSPSPSIPVVGEHSPFSDSSSPPSPAMLSAASAGDLSAYRPPPPIPARARSIPSSPAGHHLTRPSRSVSDASISNQSNGSISPPSSRPPAQSFASHPVPAPPSSIAKTSISSIRPPPSRTIAPGNKVAPVRPAVQPLLQGSESDDDEDPSTNASTTGKLADSVPDASLASRRPPTYTASGMHIRFTTTSRYTCAIVRGSWLVVGSAHHVRVYDLNTKATILNVPVSAEASKVTALNFRTDVKDDGSTPVIWAGTKDGNLVEVDLTTGNITASRNNIHPGAILRVDRVKNGMVTLGEMGKLLYWENDKTEGYPLMGFQSTEARRLHEDASMVELIHGRLWASSGPSAKSDLKTPVVRIYEPSAKPTFDLTPRPLLVPSTSSVAAPSTASCACTVPAQQDLVYIGHESGHVTVWRESTRSYVLSLRVATASVTTMVGVDRYLWCGFKSGKILIFDTSSNPWQLIVSFKAHNDAVAKLMVNSKMLWEGGELPIVSLSSEGEVAVWDGLLSQWFLDKRMTLREAEYSTYRKAKCLVVSWNVDAQKPSALDDKPENHAFLQYCLQTCDSPDIIVFSFQELIDLENKTLAAKSFIFGRKKGDKNMQEQVSHGYHLWRDRLAQEIRVAMPAHCPYSLVHAEVLVGLFTCIFVKDSEKPKLRDLNISQVKTGLAGRFGNKGSIVARMVLDDTSICFSNCHLAAGQSHVRQRNKDLVDILDSGDALPAVADFSPNAYIGGGDGSMIFDHNIVILSGDLNYRIDMRRDAVIERIQSGRFDLLWDHDQLVKQIRTNPQHRLRSFKESELAFAPTYKYDRGTQDYDTSEKARCPAWCDRILWRSIGTGQGETAVVSHDFRRYEADISDHRPISAVLSLPIRREESSLRKGVLDSCQSDWSQVKEGLVQQSMLYFKDYVS